MPLPVLLVHGEADINPISSVQELLPFSGAPSCELVVVPGAGHLVEFADVDGFARILEDLVLARLSE
jgi:pimeloyl-ACP methyl ester carboxylesterase